MSRCGAVRALGTVLVLVPIVGPLAVMIGLPAVAGALDAAWSALCHQRPDRSLELLGTRMPMCTRCLGIVVGLGVGMALRPRTLLPARTTHMFVVGLIIVIADARFQWSAGDPVWRALTGGVVGLPAGASLAWMLSRADQPVMAGRGGSS